MRNGRYQQMAHKERTTAMGFLPCLYKEQQKSIQIEGVIKSHDLRKRHLGIGTDWVYVVSNQSTSMPLLLSSFLAISISPINSLCASGTSLKVNTPQPSLNNRYAPKETRTQKGSYGDGPVSIYLRGASERPGTYDWYDLVLDLRTEWYQFEEAGEVELCWALVDADSPVIGPRNSGRTEDTRRPSEMVCWARVMAELFRLSGRFD